jgi:hypothetical protein
MVRPAKPKNEIMLPDIPEDEPQEGQDAPSLEMTEAIRKALATPEGRAAVREASQAAAQEVADNFKRDYTRDPNLRVTGGHEVVHDKDFLPKPPAYIPMYVGANGGETNYLEPHYVTEKRLVPRKEDGKVVLTTDGNPVADEVFTDVMVDPGAKVANGSPVFTDGYKAFLRAWKAGKNLNGNVRSDIQAGTYVDQGVSIE